MCDQHQLPNKPSRASMQAMCTLRLQQLPALSSAHLHADHAPAGRVREVDVVEVAQEGLRIGRRQVLQQPAGGNARAPVGIRD